MRVSIVMVAFAAFVTLAASPSSARAANDVPDFDVKPSCQSATRAASDLNQAGDNLRAGDRSSDNCVQDEMKAKATLSDEWTHFKISERQRCARLATLGGLPSYVELLTCLEMAQEAANIPDGRPAAKTRPGR